jgi:hypothetical protein
MTHGEQAFVRLPGGFFHINRFRTGLNDLSKSRPNSISDMPELPDCPFGRKDRFMSRVFAYCRVSTADQVTANQRQEIAAAGFAIESRRVMEECISGSVAASERPWLHASF